MEIKESVYGGVFETIEKKFYGYVFPCGSRVICNPPPTDTDKDYLVRVGAYCTLEEKETRLKNFFEYLKSQGYEHENEEYQEGDFNSFRKGEINLIVMSDPEAVDKFVLATYIAKKFNLTKKAERIMLFEAIMYGKTTSEVFK